MSRVRAAPFCAQRNNLATRLNVMGCVASCALHATRSVADSHVVCVDLEMLASALIKRPASANACRIDK